MPLLSVDFVQIISMCGSYCHLHVNPEDLVEAVVFCNNKSCHALKH